MLVAVLAGCLLTVTGIGAAGAQAPAASPDLTWRGCSYAPGFQCGELTVPLDYDEPSGPNMSVAVIRRPATDPGHRIGSLFWNPGGPGGAGTSSLPTFYPLFPAPLRARFDIVSFDPRGIGGSNPLRCFGTPAEEEALLSRLPAGGFPVGAAQVRRTIAIYARFAQACAAHGGPIQRHMSTANVARDMDRIRQAVGDRTLSYYGTSYGTYLGVTYATLFPATTGRIVLDGNVPPVEWNDARAGATVNTFARLRSPLGTEAGLRLMLAQCGLAGPARCAFSAGSVAATTAKYRTLLRRVSARPVTLSGQRYTYAVTVSAVASGLIAQNRNSVTPGWRELAEVLQSLWRLTARGTTDTPVTAAAPGLPTTAGPGRPSGPSTSAAPAQPPAVLPEAIQGVLCSESPNPRDPRSYQRQAHRANATQSPNGFGYVWTWLAEPCAQWQAVDADRYAGPWDRSTTPHLLIGTLADSNTAYTGTLRMAAELPNSRILTETGGGHTALLNKSDCVDRYVSGYFLTGALPPPATVCRQNQQPF